MSIVRSKRRSLASFSLVEVAIALGIVTFAIVSLFGLLVVGMQANRASQGDTALALASKYVLSSLRTTNVWPASQTIYFDYQGVATNISRQPTFYTNITTTAASTTANLTTVVMTFTWPGQTNKTGPYAHVFSSTLSGY